MIKVTCQTVMDLRRKYQAALVLDENAKAYATGYFRAKDGSLVCIPHSRVLIVKVSYQYVTAVVDGKELDIRPDPDEHDTFKTEFLIEA